MSQVFPKIARTRAICATDTVEIVMKNYQDYTCLTDGCGRIAEGSYFVNRVTPQERDPSRQERIRWIILSCFPHRTFNAHTALGDRVEPIFECIGDRSNAS